MFQDKTVLVTGASRGIGCAIATQLGKQGAIVIGTATTSDGAQKIIDLFRQEGIQGTAYVMDVCDQQRVGEILSTLQQTFSPPLILINNAGITADNIVLRMKAEQWNRVIQTNLSAVFHLTKACLKPMVKARWGRIINMTSVVGVIGNMGQGNYAAAKAGLIGFSKSIAQELAGYGITINCVAPGFIETDMTQSLSEKQQETIFAKIPMRRMGRPQEIASAVAFLASDQAAYITGETLHVNGGMYMA
ncbi:MAG: 3-oxoacyl-[acyl-carrier-protein] reductase [Coxiella sp. RIFCSPHIGHO2_12_FULL_44_14]|nr:MAG: 3-oxoacyl-[acyl-carrier-protein] reductase [Coxiella sp. RIFCSPHIGHO2_12_FULL_44_14]